ncbi:MAG: methionyl-tRNA synthetase [Cyphobasidiales sp. Tagirdzhanova-0007]|nr:MAG: methionyl-tRNA synthetase [Cyphobasidiales sp. Tagirdzhanova-0007]
MILRILRREKPLCLLFEPQLLLRSTSYRPFHAFSRSLAKPYYVTTPIFYVNAEPHIGHLHSLVLADVFKRYRQLRDGDSRSEPVLLTGTDEHGMKIQKAAQARMIQPVELCNEVSQRFRALAEAAGVQYDIFFRTTETRHAEAVQHVWRELERKGYVYKAHYEGWYSVSDEAYYTDSQIREEIGKTGSRVKVSVETGQPVEWMQEENYMFKLGAFQEKLVMWLKENPEAVQPKVRYNEVMSYLITTPLGDLSISRPRSRLDWGIPVPDDPSHTVYVWIDALVNYVTACGYPKPNEPNIWPADVHVIGKDILRFHAIYWPAILMALDLPLPTTILAHAHWTMDQHKMSKSRGNVVNPFSAIKRFTKDGIRYFLVSKGGLHADSDFSEQHVARDYRKDLAGQAGNIIQRLQSRTMQVKMQAALGAEQTSPDDEGTSALRLQISTLPERVDQAMRSFEASRALDAIFATLADVNAYLAIKEPWRMSDAPALASVISLVLEGIRIVFILLQPFIPESSDRLLDALGILAGERKWKSIEQSDDAAGMARMMETIQQHGPQPAVFLALRDEDRQLRSTRK